MRSAEVIREEEERLTEEQTTVPGRTRSRSRVGTSRRSHGRRALRSRHRRSAGRRPIMPRGVHIPYINKRR